MWVPSDLAGSWPASASRKLSRGIPRARWWPESLSLPLSVHLPEYRWQRAPVTDSKPSAPIMVERDRARTHSGGVQANVHCPRPKLCVVFETYHVDIKGATLSLKRLHRGIAPRAGLFHEYGKALRCADIRDRRPCQWGRGELDGLKVRIESLPGGIVGALVGKNPGNPLAFHTHLEIGVMLALGFRTRLDTERCQRIEVWAPNTNRPFHEAAIACPLVRLQAPISRKARIERYIGA